MRATISAILIALALVLVACGGDDSTNSTPAGTSGDAASACEQVDQPDPKKVKLKEPPLKAPPEGTTVTFDTNCGSFTVELDTKGAPKTSASFAYLAQEGLFDDTPFHRVAPGFVVQAGDPLGGDPSSPEPADRVIR